MQEDKFLSDSEKKFISSYVDKILNEMEEISDEMKRSIEFGLNIKKSIAADDDRVKSSVRGILERELIGNVSNWCSGVEHDVDKLEGLDNFSLRMQILVDVRKLKIFCDSFVGAIAFPVAADERISKLLIRIDEIEEKANSWKLQYDQYAANANKSLGELFVRQDKFAVDKTNQALVKIGEYEASVGEASKKLSDLISKMASSGLTLEYMENAGKEKKAADFYRRVSLFVMSGIGLFSVILFVILELELPTAQHTMTRLAMALFFTFIVAYTARQSALHRVQEHSYMRKAMDLNAITPYLASMPEDSQNTIKGQLAQKLFAPAESQNGCDSANFGLLEVVTKLTDKIPKAPA
ncbi:hypothetical protein [Delftia acidovorans]|uniref:hypothetical protein n=1 Tax=Delftia acidovorans TaxID=80866 RepID=UPI000BC41890|nr:hypothetical protein [Delftia acidovorans]SOE35275.1 hypothetical protein SAMN05216519_1255 [Delftia acidovorans]